MKLGPFRASMLAASAVAVLFLAFRSGAERPRGAGRPPTSVAVVNLGRVIEGLDEAKDARTKLANRRADAEKKLQELGERLSKLDSGLEVMEGRKDTPEYRALLGERIEVAATGRARREILQQLADEDEGRVTRAMYLKVLDALKRFAATEGIDLVLRDEGDILPPEKVRDRADSPLRPITGREVRSVTDQRLILFAGEQVDVTALLITAMNNEYKLAPR